MLHCSLELVHTVQIFDHTFTVSVFLIAYHIPVSYHCQTRGPCKYYMFGQFAMKLEKTGKMGSLIAFQAFGLLVVILGPLCKCHLCNTYHPKACKEQNYNTEAQVPDSCSQHINTSSSSKAAHSIECSLYLDLQ